MADADEEPAPPADLQIDASAASGADADTAMEAEPAAPTDVPMASADSAAVAMDADTQPGSGLDEQLLQAAQAAGIDLAFLEALPEELRSEASPHLIRCCTCAHQLFLFTR